MKQDKAQVLEGSVFRIILKYAVPTILSQLVTLIYNLTDTYFVGNTNNPSQVAALTLSFPLFMSMTLIGNLFGIGANSLISRSLGAGEKDLARKVSAFAFYGALGVTLLWVIFFGALQAPILRLIGARTEETFAATKAYLGWTVLIGGLPTVASLMLAHIVRGEGNTAKASLGIAVGGILNILLDPIFVQILGMGASGAGLATLISNCISLLFLLWHVLFSGKSVLSLNPKNVNLQPRLMGEVVLVGLPAALVILFGSGSNIVLTHLMSAFGDTSVAAYGVVQKLGTVTIQITIGVTQGIMPLLGYCFGAGAIPRVKEIIRCSVILVCVYAAMCVVLLELFPAPMIRFFIQESETVSIGTVFLRRWILCAPGMCFVMLFNSIFQSMGMWKESLFLSVFRQGLLLIPLLFLLNALMGAIGLVTAYPIADTCSLLLAILVYSRARKKLDKLAG